MPDLAIFILNLNIGGAEKNSVILVNKEIKYKLMSSGNIEDRRVLEEIVHTLNLLGKIFFVGFQKNVADYYYHADLFVLSSIKEGMPNVLLEALQFGLTIVSTDCESGPSEILDNGRYGILVPIKDQKALKDGIVKGLNNPYDKNFLKSRVDEFNLEKTIQAYNHLLFCEEGL